MTEESNTFIPINEKEIISENINKISIPNNIKQNLILPNLNSNYVTLSTNNINENKIAFNPMKKYEQKNIDKTKHLNKSSSYKNLKERDLKEYNEKYKGKILSNSNRVLNNESLKMKGSYINNNYQSMRDQKIKLKKNFFGDRIQQYKRALLNGQYSKDSNDKINLNITKNNTNTNEENSKDTKNSIYKLSKINLNKYPMTRINNGQNNKNLKNSPYSKIHKHSKFFHQSKKKDISSQTIYKYYINKSSSEVILPVKNYDKLFDNKRTTVVEKLKRIYCENENFDFIIQELKDNRKLAFKDDFDVEEYQNALLEILEKRISHKNLVNLQDDYRELNKKLYNVFEPKGRFTFLAEKLRYNLPSFLIEKLRQLDKDSIISRMNYYNQFKEFRKDNKLKIIFGRRDDSMSNIKKKKRSKLKNI